MATRANIVLKNGETTLWIYRHWDGYAACAGSDLARIIKVAQRKSQYRLLPRIVEALLAETYPGNGKHVYELTTGKHGDIEWLYEIFFKGNEIVTVSASERNMMTNTWKTHPVIRLSNFRGFCARELLDMRKRINARRKARAGAA